MGLINDSLVETVFNKFNNIKIEILEKGASVSCHNMATKDSDWQSINFQQIPQQQYFCLLLLLEIVFLQILEKMISNLFF